jgi:hypothetical protein
MDKRRRLRRQANTTTARKRMFVGMKVEGRWRTRRGNQKVGEKGKLGSRGSRRSDYVPAGATCGVSLSGARGWVEEA